MFKDMLKELDYELFVYVHWNGTLARMHDVG